MFGSAAELEKDQLRGDPTADGWTDEDHLVLAMCDELHATSTITDELWRTLAAHFAPDQIIELLVLAGLYHAVSYVANACQLDPEPWVQR